MGPSMWWPGRDETAHGRDIVLTKVDIDNLLRAKAAIYAGYHRAVRRAWVSTWPMSSRC